MDYIIIGCGDMGRQVAALLRAIDPTWPLTFATERESDPATVHGIQVMKLCDVFKPFHYTIAIQNSIARERIATLCRQMNGSPFNVKSERAFIYPHSEIGEGYFIGDFNLIHCDVRIGRHFHANSFCYVGVDSVVGNFVTLTHHNAIARGVIIEDHAFIGQGATVAPGVRIGHHAKIGMGATILGDVPPYTLATGIWKGSK